MTPYRALDDNARDTLMRLMAGMTHASLAVLDADGHPMISRIGAQPGADGAPVALLSGLAAHTAALRRDPRGALMIGEAPARGEALTHPRLSLQIRAAPLEATADLRAAWLARNPKAAIYIDLPDFTFWRLVPVAGLLNAGFGAAFPLTPADMPKPPQGTPRGGQS